VLEWGDDLLDVVLLDNPRVRAALGLTNLGEER